MPTSENIKLQAILPDSKNPTYKGKILVVDDDVDVRAYLKHLLELHGFEVLESWYSLQAIELVRQNRPDLVLLDLQLDNGESGLELCKKLRAIQDSWTMKIVMLTGMSESHYEISGYNCGADGYVMKSPDSNKLIAVINAQLKKYDNTVESKAPSPVQIPRDSSKDNSQIEKCGFTVCLLTRQIWHEGKIISNLTPKEEDVLICLLQYNPAAVSLGKFVDKVWKNGSLTPHTLAIHIYNLKKKLPPAAARKIQTDRTNGYRILG